ncbi:thymidine phosphorylase [Stenotrophomonas maltophilia]|uniref:Thymidine phosphorylase n=1 Tax=Stenotrophomonas maltophilia TaxID=40324 RepID=A0A246HQD5_STEMA|nr:thymidine phosphorylase [Stenotrophomonas maltophilia]
MSAPAPSSSQPDMTRFADVAAPPRVRRLLAALHGLAVQTLTAPLKLTIVELERELFRDAERARNSQIQADIFAQARQLHEVNAQFGPRFLGALGDSLATLRGPRHTQRIVPTEVSVSATTLTLVNDTDVDRDIVLVDIIRREAQRSATPLQLLGQRFGVLAAGPAFDVDDLPFGPQALCRIVRELGQQFGLGLETQLALYRVFDRQLLERLGELLERANILLAHEGVLPGLVYTPYLARSATTRRIITGPERGLPGARGGAAARPLTGWNGSAPSTGWAAMTQEAMAPPAAGPAHGAPNGDAAAPGPAASASASAPANSVPPAATDLGAPAMSALHQLLGAARQAHAAGTVPGGNAMAAQAVAATTGAPTPAADNAFLAPDVPAALAVPAEAVHATLAKLQSQAIAPGGARRSMADLHNALLAQVRADHGAQAALTVKDSDTFDLLDMLYGQIQREVRPDAVSADLLTRLQVPVARAALSDPAFFVRDQHPARELLNAVAEAGANWLGEEDVDPQLVQKLGLAVDQVVNDYDGDVAVFDTANEEIQQHFRALAHKAELAERRHVEAARGKERLEAAKQQASTSMEQLCAQAAPPRFVQALLKQAWSDVLTLTLLRNGETSPQWQQRQQETARIAEVTCLAPGAAARDDALGNEVESALLQVGYHQDEAAAIARRLSTPGGEDDSSSRTELTARLRARTRLGEQADAGDPRKVAPLARSTAEDDCYRQLRTLPFGTWFEFTTNQQGDVRRQRLSWYSLITDNALFVNQRGQKVGEHSLDALARLMAHGQVRIVTEDKGRLIDRAWQATLRTLRSLAGSPAENAE